jgi:TolB-like protein
MRATTLIFLLLSRLAPTSLGAPAQQPKPETLLAVMDIVNNTGEFSAFVDGMPDMLITELMESGDVKLVERTKVHTAMKALKLETSGLTQERNLELGKWLGVDGILFGAFNRVGEHYRLDVRAIDVQTGKINVAASASCPKQNIQDIIPEIGKQLRLKLNAATLAKEGGRISVLPTAPILVKPLADSCPFQIEYKMMVSLLSEASIPHQKVRIYLDNNLLGVSSVVGELNRYFLVFQGNIPIGKHTVSLVHGAVDKRGRWVRELENQPKPYSFEVQKGDRPGLNYKMQAHENWFNFNDFAFTYHNYNPGD